MVWIKIITSLSLGTFMVSMNRNLHKNAKFVGKKNYFDIRDVLVFTHSPTCTD